MHIVMIGGSGKVGRIALQHLLTSNSVEDLQLTLISPRPNKDAGLLLDIENMLPLKWSADKKSGYSAIKTNTTDDYAAIKNADMVVITASLWASKEEREIFEKFDTTGRLVQSYANYNLIADISKKIAGYAPDALTLVVTNQSDMMAEAARQFLPKQNVLGFGGIVDSSRFRMILSQCLYDQDLKRVAQNYIHEKGHIIGHHNNDMFLLSSSLNSSGITETVLTHALGKTRSFGGSIAILQRDPRSSSMATGASVLPGYALYLAIAAYIGQTPSIEESFNVSIVDAEAANIYGIPCGSSLSVPILLEAGRYTIAKQYPLTSAERASLVAAQTSMSRDCEKLRLDMAQPQRSFPLPRYRPAGGPRTD